MPAPRVNWEAVRGIAQEQGLDGRDLALFALPTSGRDLLLSVIDLLTYRATYRINDYDYSDWDELQLIVDETLTGLMGNVMLSDVNANLDRIATALEGCCTIPVLTEINETIANLELSPVVNVDCSGGSGGGNNVLKDYRVPDDWQNDWPSEPVPESQDPTSEPMGNLCDAAHSAWQEIDTWFQQFADNVNAENPYSETVEELAEFQLNNAYAGWVWQMMNAIVALWYDNLLADVAEHWLSLKDAFICKVLEVDNASELRSWVFQAIRTEPPTWSAGYYMEVLLTGTSFNSLYDGTYVPFPEFIGSDCTACGQMDFPDAPANYAIVYPEVGEVTPRNVNNATGTFNGIDFNYQSGVGEWNGCFFDFDTQAILARSGGLRIDGWMVVRLDGDGNEGQYDKLDMYLGTDMTMLSADTMDYKKLWYNESFAADLSSFIPQFNENTIYGAAPVQVTDALAIVQAVSHFGPHAYTWRMALLIRMT